MCYALRFSQGSAELASANSKVMLFAFFLTLVIFQSRYWRQMVALNQNVATVNGSKPLFQYYLHIHIK